MMANTGHVMTLANSIIGVGILAMPYCFQKCGIILSIFLLVISNFITRISCHYLIKSSILTRRKSFEFLGFHAFGSSGKLMVELCIIGYLIGTCIAYFVVIGDLGPQITAKVLHIPETDRLRTWIMVIVTVLCIIPLGLLKNVDSLSVVCTASIGFYFCLVLKVIGESKANFLSSGWTNYVEFWRPAGVLQCLPIFSMALSCQMQLFEVQETVPNLSVEKMNRIVRNATTICTYVYIFVGFFGYVAFCKQSFAGNILINFSPSLASDAIKIGFVLSVAFSFPLVIFPCRASIYSLLYRRGHMDASGYIPETRFKAITVSIAVLSLVIALLIPSIELVIGLVGSTIGVAICIMFPASCYMKVIKKESTEKLLAQFILIGGFCLMILGTYANLSAIDEKRSGPTAPAREITKIDAKLIETVTRFDNLSDFKLVRNKNYQLEKEDKLKLVIVPDTYEASKPDVNKIDVQKEIEKKILNEIINKGGEKKESNEKNKEQVESKIDKPNIVKPKENSNIPTGNTGINKDAIIKEELVVAEEEQKEKNIELEKTKDFIEQKVNELKEELVKRNKETQNLVQEKLEDIAEQVQQIEAAQKDAPKSSVEKKEENVDTLKSKIESIANSILNSTNEKIEIKMLDKVDKKTAVKEESKGDEKVVKTIDIVSPQKQPPAEEKKTDELAPVTTVYEPQSYKVGEKMHDLVEKSAKGKILPLPLLLNASLQKNGSSLVGLNVKSDKEVKLVALTEKSVVMEKKQELEKKTNEDKKIEEIKGKQEHVKDMNVDAMRRDILQANTESTGMETDIAQRLKRSISKEVCKDESLAITDCLEKDLMNVDIKSLIDTKSLVFGRDLKSIDETVEK